MGMYFKPDMSTSHALSQKDSSQYWQMAAESVGMATDQPSGEAILLKVVHSTPPPLKVVRTFLPEMATEETLPQWALAS